VIPFYFLIPFLGVIQIPTNSYPMINSASNHLQFLSNIPYEIFLGLSDDDDPLMNEPTSRLINVNIRSTFQKQLSTKNDAVTSIISSEFFMTHGVVLPEPAAPYVSTLRCW
jgi:hypothetical protein